MSFYVVVEAVRRAGRVPLFRLRYGPFKFQSIAERARTALKAQHPRAAVRIEDAITSR